MPTPLALARQIANRVNLRDIMIAPQADFAADLVQLSQADTNSEKARVVEARMDLVAMYGLDGYTEKPFAYANGLAVIPVHGSLINRFTHSWGFITGYNFIQNQLRAALDDDDVKAIIFDCNSRGGEVNGLFETADEIYLSRGKKPLVAMVDTDSYSACYAVASSCDRIILTPSGGVGSIGAMCLHVSLEKMLDNFGVKVTPIFSGDHKVDGNPYKDLPENVRLDIQKSVNESRATFVSLVARNRAIEEQVIFDTQARCYRATEALELGLIDEILTPSQAAIRLLNELDSSPDDIEDDQMTPAEQLAADQATIAAAAAAPSAEQLAAAQARIAAAAPATPAVPAAPAAAPAASAAVDPAAAQQAERQRCQGITGCEEAKGKEQLANHLAFNTSMSVEEAKKTLAASGPAAAPVATTEKPNNEAAADPFKQKMDNDQQPNVGADGDLASQQANEQNPLLAAYAVVHGKPLGA
jgi:signal peptide peptidase SppA